MAGRGVAVQVARGGGGLVDPSDAGAEVTRVPTREDLVRLARSLNEVGARYVVVGGMAMIASGLLRTTMDVDLLVDASPENVTKVSRALAVLPDGASLEVEPGDVRKYAVVRINDEITVDLLGQAGGVSYGEAAAAIEWQEMDGVRVPFASARLLWETKGTHREKDALDRSFLEALLRERGEDAPDGG